MNNISKILSFCFLIIFGATLLLNTLSLLSIASHKERVRHEIQFSKKNTYLFFTKEKWEQIEKIDDDEINVNGKMFDIKSIQVTSTIVEICGHYDTKEDNLLAQSKESEKQLIKKVSFFQPYFFEKIEIFKSKKVVILNEKGSKGMINDILKGYLQCFEQPPRA